MWAGGILVAAARPVPGEGGVFGSAQNPNNSVVGVLQDFGVSAAMADHLADLVMRIRAILVGAVHDVSETTGT